MVNMSKVSEDQYTSTVSAAAAYEQWRAQDDHQEPENQDYDNWYDEYFDEDYDYCGCSDPGCPCEGAKSGPL